MIEIKTALPWAWVFSRLENFDSRFYSQKTFISLWILWKFLISFY